MTNATKLRELKHTYNLTSKKTACLLGVSIHTVNSWLINSDSEMYRPMPDNRLHHLRLILKRRKKVNI